MSTDGIKWRPSVTVIKYNAASTAEITDMLGHEPTGPELRELERLGIIAPDDVLVSEGNILVANGLGRITSLITGAGGAALTNALGFIGVGTNPTPSAAAVTQTTLDGNGNASTARYNALDVAFPSLSNTNAGAGNDTINVSAQFGSGVAQFVWAEWCIGIISSGTVTPGATMASIGTTPIMLNRKVDSLGTKGAGSTWTLAAKIVLS